MIQGIKNIRRKALVLVGFSMLGAISVVQNLPFFKKDVLSDNDLANLISEKAYADVPAGDGPSGPADAPWGDGCPAPDGPDGPCG